MREGGAAAAAAAQTRVLKHGRRRRALSVLAPCAASAPPPPLPPQRPCRIGERGSTRAGRAGSLGAALARPTTHPNLGAEDKHENNLTAQMRGRAGSRGQGDAWASARAVQSVPLPSTAATAAAYLSSVCSGSLGAGGRGGGTCKRLPEGRVVVIFGTTDRAAADAAITASGIPFLLPSPV